MSNWKTIVIDLDSESLVVSEGPIRYLADGHGDVLIWPSCRGEEGFVFTMDPNDARFPTRVIEFHELFVEGEDEFIDAFLDEGEHQEYDSFEKLWPGIAKNIEILCKND